MLRILPIILLLFVSGSAVADTELIKLKRIVARVLPGAALDKLRSSPVPGLYEVIVGTDIYYITRDGRYIISGTIFNTKNHTNLTAIKRNALRIAAINAVGESNMIIFSLPKPKRTITVFTDVDCPYCTKSHLDVPKLIRAGIKVRYLLFPRAGIGSATYKKSVAVWCAKDRRKALGVAKAGGKLKYRTCPNPVAGHFRLGQKIGVRDTPTIVLDNGRVLPGYYPPRVLMILLGLRKARK
jgi:thiol:disulfide interchange protein DsbC